MIGQWEVVGKKKEKNNKVNANKKETTEKKKTIHSFPVDYNLEEFLPKSEVKNLYNNEKNNKENKKPVEKSKPQNSNKKQQKKVEKSQEILKTKPKTIQSALSSIDVDEFNSIFEKNKSHFPDAPVVWLKELTQYLNQKVPVDVQDPTFASKAPGYPLNLVPSPLKSVFEKSFKDAGKSNAQLFFDIALTSMATDMSKGLPALGFKLYLQYLATSDPSIVVPSLSKHVVLRNSYQNRPNIGLSILWAVGQAGLQDFDIGMKIFQELMFPLVEMKNYSRYIIAYLLSIIKANKAAELSKENYLLILDTVYGNKKYFPTDLKGDMVAIHQSLKDLLFSKGHNKYHSYVECFFKKLNSCDNNKLYQERLCDVLVECFVRDSTSFSAWSSNYAKSLTSSSILIDYIDANWKTVSLKLNKKLFSEILNTFKITNEELMTKRKKDEGLNEVIHSIKKVTEKMVQKKSTGFPLKTFVVILSILVGVLISVDVNQNGSWQDSSTRRLLKDSGVCEYTHKALNRTKEGLQWVDKQVEGRFPGFRQTVVDISEPYVKLSKELGLVCYNAGVNIKDGIVQKYPVVVSTIDSYAPGLIDSSQKVISNVWSSTTYYVNKGIVYLREDVFVGHLSPENMQRIVIEAFNTTKQKASECYHWIYEKVQTTIK